MPNKYKKILIAVISIILLLILTYISNLYTSQEVIDYISKADIYAPAIYILIQILGQIFAPLSTSVLFVAGFILFGQKAILYMLIVWTITSITNFLIAKRFGKPVLKFFVGKEGLNTVEDIVRGLSTKKYLLLRFLTFYMNDFASYAFGLTNIKFVTYMLITILCMIPWAILTIYMMQDSSNILVTTIKVLGVTIPFSIVGYIFFKKISLKTLFRNILFKLQNRGN
jgi:uncharacterized membrane protein YdjX (TVP38/TMEM64 family)